MGKDSTRDELIDDLRKLTSKYSARKMTAAEIVGAFEFIKFCIIDGIINEESKE